MQKQKAVFFDRDGVLSQVFFRDGKPVAPLDPKDFKLVPDAESCVKNLSAAGYVLVVVTNQPDVVRGWLAPEALEAMNAMLLRKLGGPAGIRSIYICPHDNQDNCSCRKPKPGLLLKGAEEWNIDLGASFMIGDRKVDVDAGKAAGCKTLLIEADYNRGVQADFNAPDLSAAAAWILKGK